MPKKKSTKKPANRVRKGPTNGDSQKRISGTLLLRYRAASAEWSESRVLLEQGIHRLDAEKSRPVHAPLVKLLDEYQQLLGDLKECSIALHKVQQDIAKKLGVTDLKKFFEGHVIDTKTGDVKPSDEVSEQTS